MKFTHSTYELKADMEYEIYTCLNAINKPDVERYGIPAVYYYGKWKNYTMMAITLLDSKIKQIFNDVDILIWFQDYVSMIQILPIRSQPLKKFFFFIF